MIVVWLRTNRHKLNAMYTVRWKMRNLEQLSKTSPKKFAEQADALKRLLW
jgi:hypothetical protein